MKVDMVKYSYSSHLHVKSPISNLNPLHSQVHSHTISTHTATAARTPQTPAGGVEEVTAAAMRETGTPIQIELQSYYV